MSFIWSISTITEWYEYFLTFDFVDNSTPHANGLMVFFPHKIEIIYRNKLLTIFYGLISKLFIEIIYFSIFFIKVKIIYLFYTNFK